MIEIIAPEPTKGIFLDSFKNDYPDLYDSDVTIFMLSDMKDFPQDYKTITQKAEEGRKNLMVSFAGKVLAGSNEFQGVMGHSNVEFLSLPVSISDMANEIRNLLNSPGRPKDELAIELSDVKMPHDAISTLKHNIENIEKGNTHLSSSWLSMAKKLYGDLPFEELVQKVKEAQLSDLPSMFEGRKLDGAFFDIEGTLVQNGELNKDLLKEMKELRNTKPITIWTDGIIADYQWLRDEGIMYKILPKQIFKGATVEEVFDDLTQEEFAEKHQINAEIYHNVEPAESLREGDNPSKTA